MYKLNIICRVLPMLVALALSACGSGATTSGTGEPAIYETPPAAGAVETQAPTRVEPPATATPVFVPEVLEQSDGDFHVKLKTADEVLVSEPEYTLSGEAPEGTVVTVNDEILMVDAQQAFSIAVPLEEGPNLIEVIASDPAGREVQFVVVATYQTTP